MWRKNRIYWPKKDALVGTWKTPQMQTELDCELKQRFGIGKEVIKMTFHPYVYPDHSLLEKGTVSK